jgi:hypothetical protein
VIEDRGDRFFPVVIEQLASEAAGATLTRPVERDDVEARVREVDPQRNELLDQRVEPAEQLDSPVARTTSA